MIYNNTHEQLKQNVPVDTENNKQITLLTGFQTVQNKIPHNFHPYYKSTHQ